MALPKKEMPAEQIAEQLQLLKTRFEKHKNRHVAIQWSEVEKRLIDSPHKLWSLLQMEMSGGEPDVVGQDAKTGEFFFFDCAAETPKGRRSTSYDPDAIASRKEFKPAHSAIGMATEMGVSVLDKAQYHYLQQLGKFDTKTSSWILTPADIREKGGALFCDWRYGHVFVYHNGAESYYAARGFRACLRV